MLSNRKQRWACLKLAASHYFLKSLYITEKNNKPGEFSEITLEKVCLSGFQGLGSVHTNRYFAAFAHLIHMKNSVVTIKLQKGNNKAKLVNDAMPECYFFGFMMILAPTDAA